MTVRGKGQQCKKKIIKRTQGSEELIFPHLHTVLQRVYSARGVKSEKELEQGLDHLLPYQSLLGIDKAVVCLFDALRAQKNILIIGDFDVDGATSTAVAIRALRSFGAKQVAFLVPNRFAFGYGLTPELVQLAANEFKPALIVTVDNGIANHAGVLAAKQLGIQVIITDHHLAADTLPPADAIVNPNQPHDLFPSKSIAGVGVFYVILVKALFKRSSMVSEQSIPEPNMSRL